MRAVVQHEVEVAAPASVVWGYVTDWPRQGEWIPMTRVEAVDAADGVGGQVRAWTGLGPVGFWDTMTITAWEEFADGSGRCEVLHTGAVVSGDGEFAVVARGQDRCTFVWWERLTVPAGPLGAAAWMATAPLVRKGFGTALTRMAACVEEQHGAG
jgi:hypothetical protein